MSHNFLDSIRNKFRHHDEENDEYSGIIAGEDSGSQGQDSAPSGHTIIVHDYTMERDLPAYTNVKNSLRTSLVTLLTKNHDLAYVASIIDKTVVLPMPIKGRSTPQYKDSAVFEEDKAFAQENFGTNIKAFQKLGPYTESRELLYQKIRTVYPDFALHMEQKIPAEDYMLYMSQVRAVKGLITDPIMDRSVSLKENLLRMQDRHGEVIDTIDFSRACAIEDTFIIGELERFFELLKDAPEETVDALNKEDIPVYAQTPGNGKLHKGKYSTVHYANLCMDNRKSRMRKYDEISKLYRKLDAHPEIKLELKGEYEEEK